MTFWLFGKEHFAGDEGEEGCGVENPYLLSVLKEGTGWEWELPSRVNPCHATSLFHSYE